MPGETADFISEEMIACARNRTRLAADVILVQPKPRSRFMPTYEIGSLLSGATKIPGFPLKGRHDA